MTVQLKTVSFQGIEVRAIDVQVQFSSGLPTFTLVGLPDKAVAESRERVRAALTAIGLALPPKRITVNLAPADLQKEGSHFDLPIALGILCAMEIIPEAELQGYTILGELALDASIRAVSGVLPAALHALEQERGLICPQAQGREAAWIDKLDILAPASLLALINHINGRQILSPPKADMPSLNTDRPHLPDLKDVKGQETAKRVLEIAAAGGHNLLFNGPPGAGKSMLASRLPSILPEMTPEEILEVSMIHSIAGLLKNGTLKNQRPFRDPHHSASAPAIVGGGQKARPGEISLAHRGVLFLDELPEFHRSVLETLRQPLESGHISIARAEAHITYPARIQMVAAMNPCRCGEVDPITQICARGQRCSQQYQARISAPLYDRIDLYYDVPAVKAQDLSLPPPSEGSREIAARVQAARNLQIKRYAHFPKDLRPYCNAEAEGKILEEVTVLGPEETSLLQNAAEKFRLSARAYHRVLKVSRTIADLANSEKIATPHIAEALRYRRNKAL
ncbi:YifB family Mg chelatase-like AAA ATPase [Kiloniella laminariae]|uniref:YifB family Mg chelatase-like AAA ATPase n=1 Tax=Kiloniella laminariae TaxID=454162 RepID=A0ABT4LJC1_9PROT|nr:YifB family Mg chelatase-like AAA ATPase [Kiloniella laminariae]MCZ4281214.1 YifB family Mg chelatase-like AAA ATPase [Kiloniella laminariae]